MTYALEVNLILGLFLMMAAARVAHGWRRGRVRVLFRPVERAKDRRAFHLAFGAEAGMLASVSGLAGWAMLRTWGVA